MDLFLVRFVIPISILWVILGLIGLLGNCITILFSSYRARIYWIFILISSIIDFLFILLYFTLVWLVVYYIDEDRENFIVTAFVIVMLFLPHLSNNCMLIAYIQELVLISDLDSCLRKLRNWKMMRWTVCFILFSAIPLIGMPIILITDFFVDTTEKFIFHSFWMSYVILVGIVPSILMILVVSFSHRNDYRAHQEIVSLYIFTELFG